MKNVVRIKGSATVRLQISSSAFLCYRLFRLFVMNRTVVSVGFV